MHGVKQEPFDWVVIVQEQGSWHVTLDRKSLKSELHKYRAWQSQRPANIVTVKFVCGMRDEY